MENFEILTLIIAGIALVFSGISLNLSNNSNNKSNKIQELQSRPWLIATVHKEKDSGRFYDIIEEDGAIFWSIKIDIENKGATPANNIRIPQNLNLKDIKTTNQNLNFHLQNIVLGQGQKYRYIIKVGGEPENPEKLSSMLNQYKSNDKGLIFKFKVFYTGLIATDVEYKTENTFDIKSDKYSILDDSEYN